jgi:putative ABC transport system permease protein
MLSIARSLKRTREIGLRKTIGATRGQIIKLFLTETFVVTALSLITACYLILWLIPAFNGLDIIQSSRQQINLELMKDPGLYIIFILFAIGVSLLAGLYPALYLSSFQPVNALQGAAKIAGFSRLLTRKILMGIQFAVSLMSIIFIVYFYRLHIYWLTFDPGIAMENFVDVYLQEVNPEILRNEIVSSSNVAGVSFSDDVPIYGGGKALSLRTEKMDKPRPANYFSIDPEFIPNFQIELIAGRNFSKAFSTDIATAIIINEKAVQAFELVSPEAAIGRTLASEDDAKVTVIGVVKDFNYTFPDVPIDPLVLRYRPEEFRIANIRYVPGKKDEIKAYLPYAWEKYDKVHSVHYKFLDEAQEELNSSARDLVIISVWACGFIVLITLFGLLGMVTYTTEVRVKEIGIRKVLGASVSSITYLLTKDYIRLISYAAIFAIPAGFFLSEAMMQEFAFRPDTSLWVLPAALIFILILALLTVGSQTVKAALTNPVETLKEE